MAANKVAKLSYNQMSYLCSDSCGAVTGEKEAEEEEDDNDDDKEKEAEGEGQEE